ncbi:MAG: HD domain-containing protein [bacterium]|nr:HD domain-containing protein [bacterium]
MPLPEQIKSRLEEVPLIIWQIMQKMSHQGYDIFLVGGTIRDLFLGRPINNNFDLTTSATPEQTQKLFPDSFYNNPYGMVGVPIWQTAGGKLTLNRQAGKPAMVVEITTFRSEFGYLDHRRPDKVVWGQKLEDDLKRRDFTINALCLGWYKNTAPKSLDRRQLVNSLVFVDLFEGISHLQKRLIKAIGDPNQRFKEDALRMLRAVRFAVCLDFKLEEKTQTAIKNNAGLLKHISAERIKEEFFKILTADKPDYGINLLADLGLIDFILPELLPAKQVVLSKHHKYDLWEHLLFTIKHCPDNHPITRLAALIHDIGKIQTWSILCRSCGHVFKVDYAKPNYQCPKCQTKNDPKKDSIFYNHEVYSARFARRLAQRLRLDKKSADKLYRLVRWHQFVVNENLSDKAIRRFIRHVGIDNVSAMLALRIGDRLGSGVKKAISWRMEKFINRLTEVQKQPFDIKDLKITGHDVMQVLSIKPGPQVGIILKKIFDKVQDKKLPNDRQALLEEIKKLKT